MSKAIINDKETAIPAIDLELWQACDDGDAVKALAFLDAGANVDAVNCNLSALQVACWRKDPDIVEMLIEKGANVHAVNSIGNNALHIAVIAKNVEAFAPLVRAGIGIDAKNNEESTALHLAFFQEVHDGCFELLRLGADLEARRKGMTVLDLAKAKGLSKLEEQLMAFRSSLQASRVIEDVLQGQALARP
jgi:ankyrin repeat protein